MRVAVVGLGHLGLPLALLLAEAGHEVIGVDTSPDHLARLRSGEAPHHERDLQAMLDDHGMMIDWRSEVTDAAEAEVVFIVVPTPSLPSGAFDVTIVESVIRSVAEAVPIDGSVVLCCVSTVNPGDGESVLTQALSGAAPGAEVVLTESPEFVALGDVFAGMRRPDLLLIGESSGWAGDRVSYLLRSIRSWGPGDEAGVPHVAAEHRLSLTEAEIAKLSVNAYITMKISFANTLAHLCKAMGARPAAVTNAIGADSRIGTSYLRPGGAYGGPCFPRDNQAMKAARLAVDMPSYLTDTVEDINYWQPIYAAAAVATAAGWHGSPPGAGRRVAVLGTAYKPGTAVDTESFGLKVAHNLTNAFRFDVRTHDPLAECDEPDLAKILDWAESVVLATDDPAWHTLRGGENVIDLWADE